jgi:sigma-E factor negative regulatory protein RseC
MSVVEHIGKVVEVNEGQCVVLIEQLSACVNCQARSACTASDKKEKNIEVQTENHVVVGEQVLLVGQHSLGLKAVFFAYILPLALIFVVLVVLTIVGVEETLAGTISLFAILPYYGVLRFFKDRLKREFTFKLIKLNK